MTERRTRAPRATATPPERARRSRSIAELMPQAGGAAFRRFGFIQSAVVSRWAEIVGPRYAGVSSPESIRFPAGKREAGVLTLVVEGAHATMMQHVAPAIIERVNRFFGYAAVARVTIRQSAGVARRAPTPKPAAAPRPAPAEFGAELGDSLRSIGDPELRAVLEALAGGLSLTAWPLGIVEEG